MFGDEDEAFVDIQFKALVECSKKYICGHNRTGDATPALDVHHMPTNVDKVGAMFRVVSAAARIISSRRLLIVNETLKSNVYCERQLSIAKETNNVESEASALNRLGLNYGRIGDYGKATAYLEQALVIESERGDDRKGMMHCAIVPLCHWRCARSTGRSREGRHIDVPKMCWVVRGRTF